MNILYGIKHPRDSMVFLLSKCKFLSDETYTRLKYRLIFRKKLNLDKPITLNEKIQWLKLKYRKTEYISLVDKIDVRKFVSDKIGDEYLIPILGVWDSPDEIDFDSLPNQFVLKCSHDSGSVVICKDKSSFDKSAAVKRLKSKYQKSLYWWNREWVYKQLKPRILAEKYMEDSKSGELRDYKFFCFNGQCKMLFIATNRQNSNKSTTFDFFDIDFNHIDVRQGHPNATPLPEKPKNYKEMISLAECLSDGIPFVRVDFYEVNGKTYFGELTFFHDGGMVPFEPEKWDSIFGDWLKLPELV